jgi:hypothetical protein
MRCNGAAPGQNSRTWLIPDFNWLSRQTLPTILRQKFASHSRRYPGSAGPPDSLFVCQNVIYTAMFASESINCFHMNSLKLSLFSLWIACALAQSSSSTTSGLSPSASSAAVSASAAAATASTSSHTSNVQGAAFNRFYQIWLENTVGDSSKQSNCRIMIRQLGIAISNSLLPRELLLPITMLLHIQANRIMLLPLVETISVLETTIYVQFLSRSPLSSTFLNSLESLGENTRKICLTLDSKISTILTLSITMLNMSESTILWYKPPLLN